MSYSSLNSIRGVIHGTIQGSMVGVIEGMLGVQTKARILPLYHPVYASSSDQAIRRLSHEISEAICPVSRLFRA